MFVGIIYFKKYIVVGIEKYFLFVCSFVFFYVRTGRTVTLHILKTKYVLNKHKKHKFNTHTPDEGLSVSRNVVFLLQIKY